MSRVRTPEQKAGLYKAQAEHRARNFAKYLEILKKSKCADCGEDDPVVLEFDHLPQHQKFFNISTAVGGSTRSWKLIEEEISKCEVVCANCHRRRSYARMPSNRRLMGL